MAREQFGGMKVSFAGAADTMEQVFGPAEITPAEMTKKLWAYLKAKALTVKK